MRLDVHARHDRTECYARSFYIIGQESQVWARGSRLKKDEHRPGGMDAKVRDGKIINVKGMEEHPYNKGQLCPRGEAALEFEYAPDRLKYLMKKVDGKWERISWDEAINTIATAIGKIKEDHGARAVTFGLGSIGAEDIVTAAITQRFRGAFGSPNYISAESICFHSLILSRILTFGRFPLEEPQNAKCLIIWGSNIDDSNIGRARMVREAVANGAHLIVIDPKRTMQTSYSLLLHSLRNSRWVIHMVSLMGYRMFCAGRSALIPRVNVEANLNYGVIWH